MSRRQMQNPRRPRQTGRRHRERSSIGSSSGGTSDFGSGFAFASEGFKPLSFTPTTESADHPPPVRSASFCAGAFARQGAHQRDALPGPAIGMLHPTPLAPTLSTSSVDATHGRMRDAGKSETDTGFYRFSSSPSMPTSARFDHNTFAETAPLTINGRSSFRVDPVRRRTPQSGIRQGGIRLEAILDKSKLSERVCTPKCVCFSRSRSLWPRRSICASLSPDWIGRGSVSSVGPALWCAVLTTGVVLPVCLFVQRHSWSSSLKTFQYVSGSPVPKRRNHGSNM